MLPYVCLENVKIIGNAANGPVNNYHYGGSHLFSSKSFRHNNQICLNSLRIGVKTKKLPRDRSIS
jgi:hypothetical protein